MECFLQSFAKAFNPHIFWHRHIRFHFFIPTYSPPGPVTAKGAFSSTDQIQRLADYIFEVTEKRVSLEGWECETRERANCTDTLFIAPESFKAAESYTGRSFAMQCASFVCVNCFYSPHWATSSQHIADTTHAYRQPPSEISLSLGSGESSWCTY